jgi:hypothetical protein
MVESLRIFAVVSHFPPLSWHHIVYIFDAVMRIIPAEVGCGTAFFGQLVIHYRTTNTLVNRPRAKSYRPCRIAHLQIVESVTSRFKSEHYYRDQNDLNLSSKISMQSKWLLTTIQAM